jgi:hypothetical protein
MILRPLIADPSFEIDSMQEAELRIKIEASL